MRKSKVRVFSVCVYVGTCMGYTIKKQTKYCYYHIDWQGPRFIPNLHHAFLTVLADMLSGNVTCIVTWRVARRMT